MTMADNNFNLPKLEEDVMFHALLREGILRIGLRTSWMPVLRKVPLVKWPEFISAMRSTESTHRAFR